MTTVSAELKGADGLFAAALDNHVAGSLDEALRHYGEVIEHAPKQAPEALFFMSMLALQRGDEQEALNLVMRSRQLGNTSPEFYNKFGRVLGSLSEERGDAIRLFYQSRRLLPMKQTGALSTTLSLPDIEPWYFSRKLVSVFPQRQSEFADEQKLIDKYILPGWVPPAPPFDKQSRILTMGSCFAQELRSYLAEKSVRGDLLFVPPGLNNTFALRNFIEWCVTGERSSSAYWYDEHEAGGAAKWMPQAEQAHYLDVLKNIDGLVLTVGLAEVWYDTETNGVFWRGVPKSMFDETRHRCRMSTVEENTENLRAIVDRIRSIRPDLPIIVTLSPIALKASWDSHSCFTADCLSKSVLRVAIGELMQSKQDNVHYWPSFEIVRWLGGHVEHSMFGEDGNTRHVNRGTVRLILEGFIKYYFGTALA